jgi:hypothetical protein
MPVTLIRNSVHAHLSSTSPAQHKLIVHAIVEAPTPGFQIKLVVGNPQGINRHILLLKLEVMPPSGAEPQHVVRQRVSFEAELGSEVFTQVTIENPGQEAVTVNVPQPSTPHVDAEEGSFAAAFLSIGQKGWLAVHGKVRAPTPGWAIRLVKANPQGFNPHILLLVLDAVRPTTIEPEHIVEQDVFFMEPASLGFFTAVSILNPFGESVRDIPVSSALSERAA